MKCPYDCFNCPYPDCMTDERGNLQTAKFTYTEKPVYDGVKVPPLSELIRETNQ